MKKKIETTVICLRKVLHRDNLNDLSVDLFLIQV